MLASELSDTRAAHAAAPRITVIQNDPGVPMDRFAARLGPGVRLVLAFAGETIPAADGVGDALVVLGGTMSAYSDDDAPWLPAVRDLLAGAARSGVPTLGICLGGQLLAVAGGGSVQVAAPPGREAGAAAIAWREAALADPVTGPALAAVTRAADAVGAGAGGVDAVAVTRAVSMHADAVVELPDGATWLASSEMYPYQAFRWGSALGVQFHPEAGPELAARWAAQVDDVDVPAVVADIERHADEAARFGDSLADAFVAAARGAGSRE
ncbi:type 1 glutamine amidotransferase [Myceligenerans xiligouense]|uniref:GMP synthase (Glutamine-hydrolysing) n=1 Tax=Myceligenerans xiligouense TaxID=253184 RepID=A0A3N4YIA8_9MICO|nr:type 1 glutamine amidotransferase [Myceligenerans xiligouense]RPF19837.1 GMP synthase (glutamine-hydrolysing) [Myceligenerans xiligouense]